MLNPEIALRKMVIYAIRYKIDGKTYIGKTVRTLKERISEHVRRGRFLKRPSYIDNAINKYGIDSFEILIIEECTTEDELNEREKFWIKEFNCKFPNGYNLTDGGEGTSGCVMSEASRLKIAKINKGRKHTAQARANMAAARTNKRAVRCIETGEIFCSIAEAARCSKLSDSHISAVCNKKANCFTAGGLHWEFAEKEI